MAPPRYHSTSYQEHVANLREHEYPQLATTTYLDHAGTTLYAQTLIERFSDDMKLNLFGNPHSASPSSNLSSTRVKRVRNMILQYFNADPASFDVVFVANATAAIKLVADAFREKNFWYGYHKDAHTSLVGVRQLATRGSRCFKSNAEIESWMSEDKDGEPMLRLFAYPAQSNMNGYRPPLEWSKKLRCLEEPMTTRTYILLDAASYLTTGYLDLSDAEAAPDFVALSFYKIFGFPDLGALIVHKDAGEILRERSYFGGGTVDMVIALEEAWHALHVEGPLHEVLEDGTLPFHNIVALDHAIQVHRQLYGSPSLISEHLAMLSNYAFERLDALRHYNGVRVVQIYKDPNGRYGSPKTQGPIISFNMMDAQGEVIGKARVEKLAIACGIQLRTGGVCNPGGIATSLELTSWELKRNFSYGLRCGSGTDVVGGKATGVVRISMGPMTTFEDIATFLDFVKFFFVQGCVSKHQHGTDAVPPEYITPVEGCGRSKIPVLSGDQKAYEIRRACESWHQRWCIVDQSTHEPLTESELGSRFRVSIVPEAGALIIEENIRTRGCLYSSLVTSTSDLATPKRRLQVSLWQLPGADSSEAISRSFVLKDGRKCTTTSDIGGDDFLPSHRSGCTCVLTLWC